MVAGIHEVVGQIEGVVEVKPIKTYFDGVEYKGRLEADVARMIKNLGYKFEYETNSFLLPSGIHYWPDFYILDIHLWVESRGYDTDKGESQINEFSRLISEGYIDTNKALLSGPDFGLDILPFELVNKNDAPDYLVIKYDSAQFTEYGNRYGYTTSHDVALVRCAACNHYCFIGDGSMQCRYCGTWDGNSHISYMKYFKGIKELKNKDSLLDDQTDFD